MNDTTTKFTISPAVMKGLGLTAEALLQLNEYRYSILRVERELPTRNGSAAMTLSATVALQADGGVEVVDMAASLTVEEKRIFPQPASTPANQRFILGYAALCEQTRLHIYARDDDRWLGPAAVGESDSIVQLTAGVSGTWCPELKALFLKHAAVPFYPDSPGTLNIAENVSLEEWMEASGCEHVRDHYIASDVRNFVRNSRPGTHFSNQLTRWYLHAVENDC